MITKFKLFENTNIDFENMSYWKIYGNKYNAIDILDKIIDQFTISAFNRHITTNLKSIIRALKGFIESNQYTHSNVTILSFNNNNFEFELYNSEIDKNRMVDEYKRYNLKGELKIENDKIVLDTLEVDANKYNL